MARDTAAARETGRLELVGAPGKDIQFSPYRVFTREEWARLRADTPMTLAPQELELLSGLLEELSV
ncbi:type I pantothenate kinase, partial [Bacillus mycoides]